MERLSLTPVVLAGGRGRRMGGAVKALLVTQDGSTILEVIERELAPLSETIVAVAPADLVPALEGVARVRIEIDHRRGPGAALLAVAPTISSEWIYAVGGDQPRPSAKLARTLAERAGEADVVRAVIEGVPQPLPALYRTKALVELGRARPELVSMVAIAEALSCTHVPGEALDAGERAAFLDADTPEDANTLGLTCAEPRRD